MPEPHDKMTIISMAVVASAAATLLHEGVGHGVLASVRGDIRTDPDQQPPLIPASRPLGRSGWNAREHSARIAMTGLGAGLYLLVVRQLAVRPSLLSLASGL